jgi:hypothetical protein
MKPIDILSEASTQTKNPVAKNSSKAIGGGASGAHKNPKRAEKLPREQKHKKQSMPMDESPISFDGDVHNPLVHSHKKANPHNLQTLINMATADLIRLADEAKSLQGHSDFSHKLLVWQRLVQEFQTEGNWIQTLAGRAEQIRHGIEEIKQARITGKGVSPKQRSQISKDLEEEQLEEQFCEDCGGSLAEHGKATRALCLSRKPDEDLGASNLASCKSQGLRARDGKKSHKLGKSPKSRVTVGGHKIKGNKYGGPLPDWS